MSRALAAAAILLGTAACIPEEGPLMEPGSDCLECHDGGEARRWTVAGTCAQGPNPLPCVGKGNQVTIRDAAGKTLGLRTNQAGNFYTAEPLAFPIGVSVNGTAMPGPPDGEILDQPLEGSCNRCHGGGEGNGGD